MLISTAFTPWGSDASPPIAAMSAKVAMNTSAISPPKAHTSDITSRKPTAYPEKNDTNLRLTPMRTVQRNDANHDTNGSTMNVTLTILKKNATAATAPERHTSHALSLDAPLWKAIIDKVSSPAE